MKQSFMIRMLSSKTSVSFTLVLLLSAFSFFSNGGTQSPTSETTTPSSEFQGWKLDLLGSLGFKQLLAKQPEKGNSSSLVLAQERTRRRDIFNYFRKYTGGWNISDRHYWASVGLTAVPVFAIAVAWFAFFGPGLLCLWYFCVSKDNGYNQRLHVSSIILLVIFIFAAIGGCSLLFKGEGNFHNSTTNTLRYVVHQADTTAEKLMNLSDYLAAAKKIRVAQVFLPVSVQDEINEIQTTLNMSSYILSDRTAENEEDIAFVLYSVRVTLIVVTVFMLSLAILGPVVAHFAPQQWVYGLVIFGWILVTGTLILSGTFLLLHNVTGDTCVAMNQWVENPTAHTALDDILPCVDNAQETTMRSQEVTTELVNLINLVITYVTNADFAANSMPLYFNQSGPLMPLLCNPFRPDLTYRACETREVSLSNATQVYSHFVCQVSPSGICTTTGRLTPDFYNQMSAGINLSERVYLDGPFLADLQDCTFVRQTFTDICRDYCPGLRHYSMWIYVGLLILTLAVSLSLAFWVIYARQTRHLANIREAQAAQAAQAENLRLLRQMTRLGL